MVENQRIYPTLYTILMTAIILIIMVMILSPSLLTKQLGVTRSITADAYAILSLTCIAALGMTLWGIVVGFFLRRWLPWLVTPHVIALLALAAWAFFLGAGVDFYLQRMMTLPPTLTLLLAILRLTPVLLLLTPLVPAKLLNLRAVAIK